MKKNLIILLFLLLLCLNVGCNKKRFLVKSYYLEEAFSIVPIIQILDEEQVIINLDIEDDLNKITKTLDQKYNVFNEESLIYQVNKNAGIKETVVDDEFIFIVKKAIEISNDTIVEGKSLYDISIFSVWELWNFKDNYYQYLNYSTPPQNNIIKQKLPSVNYKNISIDEDNKTILLLNEGMKIDLGSIVKGYAAELIYEYLKSLNLNNCLIDVGGNIITMGKNIGTNKNWKAGILMPFTFDKEIGYIETNPEKETLVTSGIYERYIVELNSDTKEETMYHHILNPYTGYPEDNELLSVTIVTNNSLLADGLSTAVFLMGLNMGLIYINNTENVNAVFVTKNKEIFISDNLKSRFHINEQSYIDGYKIIN